MLTRTCLLLSLIVAPIAYAQPENVKLKKELAELQGVWRLIGFEVDGKEAYLMEERQARWVIKGGKVLYGGEDLAKLTLDPSATPKCIDLAFVKSQRVHEGIYSIDKDRLKICLGVMVDGVKDRPLSFDTKGIDKYRTMIFVRDKAGTEFDGVPGFAGVQLRVEEKSKEIQVVDTIKDSPAQKAGLKKDDIVLKVGNDAAEGLEQTVNLVRQIRPGSEALLRIRRDGKEQDIKLKVGVAPFLFLE